MPKIQKIHQPKHTACGTQRSISREQQYKCFEHAIHLLGQSFLHHPENKVLRLALNNKTLRIEEYYQQLIFVVFRITFLCIAEERNTLHFNNTSTKTRAIYTKEHSFSRLRNKIREDSEPNNQNLWSQLCILMKLINRGSKTLGIPACGTSDLWSPYSCSSLLSSQCGNHDFSQVIHSLCTTIQNGSNKGIDWKKFPSEELGSVYERLLDLVPSWDDRRNLFTLQSHKDSERKSTGSYYTPKPLINILLRSVIDPVLEKATHNKYDKEAEASILALRICDPSCGAGHFLIAAAERIAKHLVLMRSPKDSSSISSKQYAKQQIIEHCIFGVDRNPMAVTLCSMALWMESMEPGKTLSSFQKNIKQGDALLGIWPQHLNDGVKTEYFSTIKDEDHRTSANLIRARNRKARKKSSSQLIHQSQNMNKLPNIQRIADTLLATTLWPKTTGRWDKHAPTHDIWLEITKGAKHRKIEQCVQFLKIKYSFFHWHLAFPTIMNNGGFDAIIGNPPYLDSEFLKRHQPYQRSALSALYDSTVGNWDIYIPFTELSIRLLKKGGRQGLVTPNKILGSDYAATLQQHILLKNKLSEIHDFSLQSMFDGASVAVVIAITEKGEPQNPHMVQFLQYKQGSTPSKKAYGTIEELRKLPNGYISFPMTCPEPSLLPWLQQHGKIIDVATLSDGATTGEAYNIQPLVQHGSQSDEHETHKIKLINTGTIDPFSILWGIKNISYLGFKGAYPVINASTLRQHFAKRFEQSQKHKVVIAGMSKRLEAAVAPPSFLCGKSAILLQPKEGVCPYAITVLLNSQAYVHLYIGLFAMRGMSGRSFNIGPRQVEQLPIPCQRLLECCPHSTVEEVLKKSNHEEHMYKKYSLSLFGQILHNEQNSKRKQALMDKAEHMIRNMMNADGNTMQSESTVQSHESTI